MSENDEEKARLYNVVLGQNALLTEQNALLAKLAPFIERQSIDAAAHAKALYDLVPLVDDKHNFLIQEQRSQHRDHRADIDAKIDKFLEGAAEDRKAIVAIVDSVTKTFVEHVIAIRTATALTSANIQRLR